MNDAGPQPTDGLQLVVVGSSAGGVEALAVVLAALPVDFPAAVVIAQHLDPTRPSHLAEVLGRKSALKVHLIEGRTSLEQGTVYIVPSNRYVSIEDGHVALSGEDADRPKPSIDLLLSSAAETYGDRLTAVILTGRGGDGAAGAVDVKQAGGTVIVQNPGTAAFSSMPLAVPPTVVDHFVELEAVGPLLQQLVTGVTLALDQREDHEDELLAILGLVSRQSGIDFRPYKPTTLLRRIGRRMAMQKASSLRGYRELLEKQPYELAELVRSLLIKVTEFFRDAAAFGYLQTEVLPDIIDRARKQDRTLRLWSAGCATGEEPYSLALLVAEALGHELPDWNVKIFATDLDGPAIGFARRGIYPATVMRDMPAAYLDRYFESSEQGYRVGRTLRQLVIFGQQDLSRGVPFPRIDLLVCRNLLIYFRPELQQSVLDLFAFSLQQTQGYLFLGKAETARPSRSTYELVNKRWRIYRCLAGPLGVPVRSAAEAADGPAPGREPRRPEEDGLATALRRSADLLVRHMPSGVVLVDRGYRVVAANAAARRLLGMRDMNPEQKDFLHTARALPYGEVRAAIDRVLRDRTPVVLPEVKLEMALPGEAHFVSLWLSHVVTEASGDCVLVAASDASELVQTRQRFDVLRQEHERVAQDLGAANLRLGEANKELQDANEELQAANEEMMLAQEELQATNEEFESTNEELQATNEELETNNEELETNNEELQATNEELEATNDELSARTSELQEASRIVEGERARLRHVVEGAPCGILLLEGSRLLVASANPPIEERLGPTPVGQPFEDVAAHSPLSVLAGHARDAYRQGTEWAGELVFPSADGTARRLTARIVPIRDPDDRIDGVLVYASESGAATG